MKDDSLPSIVEIATVTLMIVVILSIWIGGWGALLDWLT